MIGMCKPWASVAATLVRLPVVLGAVVLGSLVFGCGSRIDGKKLEGLIRDGMAAKGVTMATVACPDGLTVKKDQTFTCTGKDEAGTDATFDCALKNDTDVEWKLRGKFENMQTVAQGLAEKLGTAGQPAQGVKCPTKNLLVKKGITFSCEVPVAGEQRKMVFTCTDDDGTWETKLAD